MADTPISGLPAATALDGTEPLPLVQSGQTVKATAAQIAAKVTSGAIVSALGYTPASTAQPTFQAPLNVTLPSGEVKAQISGAAETYRYLMFSTLVAGVPSARWYVGTLADPETGSNAGTGFGVSAYDDSGSFLGTAFTIDRPTQIVTLNKSPIIPTPATSDNSTKAATTAFVKAQGYLTSAVTTLNGSAGALTITGSGGVAVSTSGSTLTVSGSSYSLPAATTAALGGIIVGPGLSITSGGTLSVTGGGSGTVTSVAATGGSTGLTFSGSPITSSGTLTLGGTLAIANGGTGQTGASAAADALLAGLSSTRGAVAYRGSAGWQALGAGTAGQVLITGGSGADPSFAGLPAPAISGRWYTNPSQYASASAPTTGTIYYHVFPVFGPLTISDIGLALSATPTNATKARFAIYAAATTGPGSLLLDCGETSGNLTFSTSPTINSLAISGNYAFSKPGVYYLACQISANPGNSCYYFTQSVAGSNPSFVQGLIMGQSSSGIFTAAPVFGCTESYTYGAFPSTASTSPTFTGSVIALTVKAA